MSSIPPNIHRFNLTALALFDQLYNAFRTPMELDLAKVGASAMPPEASEQDAWDFSIRTVDVVTWLDEEGFLPFEGQIAGDHVYQARLTLKGLTILGYMPTSLQSSGPREALIDKIKRVLATGAEKAGSEAVKSLLSEIFKISLATGTAAASSGLNV
jgi:hypothetical protein